MQPMPNAAPDTKPDTKPTVFNRPPPEQLEKAGQMLAQLKMYANQHLSRVTPHDGRFVPEEQRAEYNILLDQLYGYACDLDEPSRLAIFACYIKEEMVKRLVEIIAQVKHQWRLSEPPYTDRLRYIIDLPTVRMYLQVCQNVEQNLSKRLKQMSKDPPQTAAAEPS